MTSLADCLGLGGIIGYGGMVPDDLRNAGMDAQRHNAAAYEARMRGMQNSIPRDPILDAAVRAKEEAEAYLHRTADHLFWGMLCSMAGALLLRLAFSLH